MTDRWDIHVLDAFHLKTLVATSWNGPMPDQYKIRVALLDAAADEYGRAYVPRVGSRMQFSYGLVRYFLNEERQE